MAKFVPANNFAFSFKKKKKKKKLTFLKDIINSKKQTRERIGQAKCIYLSVQYLSRTWYILKNNKQPYRERKREIDPTLLFKYFKKIPPLKKNSCSNKFGNDVISTESFVVQTRKTKKKELSDGLIEERKQNKKKLN